MYILNKISLIIFIMFTTTIQITAQSKNEDAMSKVRLVNTKFNNQGPDHQSKNDTGNIYLSLGSGVALVSLNPYNSYYAGINFQLNAMKIVSDGYAIRGDFQYSHNASSREYSYGKGGHLNTYSVQFNFLLGNFKKNSIVSPYAIAGGGVNILKHTDTKYSYPEYDYHSMTYTGKQIEYILEDEADSFINLDCGGGLMYKISDKYKLYAEAQYTFPLFYLSRYGGGSLSIYGIFFGSPSLRVGAQIEL